MVFLNHEHWPFVQAVGRDAVCTVARPNDANVLPGEQITFIDVLSDNDRQKMRLLALLGWAIAHLPKGLQAAPIRQSNLPSLVAQEKARQCRRLSAPK